MAAPNPERKNITPRTMAPAAILHLTHAESAMAMSEIMRIQIMEPRKMPPASERFSHIQETPERFDSIPKRIRPGIQVINDSRYKSAHSLPSTYSAREKGRQKYKGSAPLARSG